MGCPNVMTIPFQTHAMADQILVTFYDKPYFADLLNLLGFKYIIAGKNECNTETGFTSFEFKPDLATTSYEEETWTKSFSNLNRRKILYDALIQNSDFIPHFINNTDVVIFENKKLFIHERSYISNPLLVLGNYKAYDFLSFPLNSSLPISPVFIAQNKTNLNRLFTISNTLLFHNTSFEDLSAILHENDYEWISPYQLKNSSWAIAFKNSNIPELNPQLPILDHSWLSNSDSGDHIFSKFSITNVSRQATLDIPIVFATGPSNDVWIRLKSNKPDQWKLFWDGQELPPVSIKHAGYEWHKIQKFYDTGIIHHLGIQTAAKEALYLDSILLSPADTWNNNIQKSYQTMKKIKMVTMFQNSLFLNSSSGKFLSFKNHIEGSHTLWIYSEIKTPRLTINGKSVRLSARRNHLYSAAINLEKKMVNISISNADFSWVALENSMPSFPTQRDSQRKSQRKSIEKLWITHTETHFPGWILETSKSKTSPLVSHLFMNGFILDDKDEPYQITYKNGFHRTWAAISFFVWLFVVLGFIWKKS